MAYAKLRDYELRALRGKSVEPEDQQLVETLLEDAAVWLDGLVDVREGDEHQAEVLKIVSCNMVARRMEEDTAGVDQVSYTMGPFAQSTHYVSPGGSWWLTKQEREELGIGAFHIGTIPAKVGGLHARP